MARVALALIAIAACLLLMQAAGKIGFSRLLTRYAAAANSLAAADEAIQLTPDDPDAHRARAMVLNRLGRYGDAERSLEIATSLRPLHAAQWLELGTTREDLEDNAGALDAYNEAVRCAPYYAQTHWQRGNLLLRAERYDDAFADLRQAAASDRKFLPKMIDLAWGVTKENVSQTQALLQIGNDNDRLEFARFLAREGKGKELLEQVNLLAAPLSDQNRQELTQLAFFAGSFRELSQLSPGSAKSGEVANGSFEEPLVIDGSPFGWKVSYAPVKPKLALDVSEHAGGQRSLQVSFEGDWPGGVPSILSQTVLVEAGQRYRLNFAVKTNDLVTGGPPRIVLTTARTFQILAKSDAFPQSTNTWQQMAVEFVVPPPTEAVMIDLSRDNCSTSPCPIFGAVWLDDFVLRKL